MARFSSRVCLLSALLVLAAPAWAHDEDSKDAADGVTVETEEEEQYHSPVVEPEHVYLAEHFDDEIAFKKRWIKSQAKKQDVDENIAKYDGVWEIQEPSRRIFKNDYGMVLTTEAKHAAIATLLDRPFHFKDKPLVVQYEVTMQEGQNCGGAYLKLLSLGGADSAAALAALTDRSPYTVMFGPDKCGNDNKLHFIFRHRNPTNGTYDEKHCKKPTQRLDDIYKDKEPHLYTLVVRPDNTFSVRVDGKEVNAGSLLEDFTPPVNPPQDIDDPSDTKPHDWDDREKIVDPSATKPEDWDEDAPAQIEDPNAVKPEGWLDDQTPMIPDPSAEKPSDWDEDMDGEWEAPLIDNPLCATAPGCGDWTPPLIPNPDYKGPWRAPLIPNPNYRGKWRARRVPNPHYFRDEHPFHMTPIVAVGFELWSMSPRLLFDNLIITDDEAVAQRWAESTFYKKRDKMQADSQSALDGLVAGLWSRPWLSALLALSSVGTVALLCYFCCSGSQEQEMDPKKTDAFVDDDAPYEGEGDGEPAGETEGVADSTEAAEGGADSERAAEQPPRAGKAMLEPQDDQPTQSEGDAAGGGDGHRKRKPRRD